MRRCHHAGCVELRDQCPQMAGGHVGGGRITSVEHQLQRCAAVRRQACIEVRSDVQHQQRPTFVDDARDVAHVAQARGMDEDAGAVEACDQFPRCLTAALVEHGIGHVVEVVGRSVAEDEGLQQNGHDQDDPIGRILRTASTSLRNKKAMRRTVAPRRRWASPDRNPCARQGGHFNLALTMVKSSIPCKIKQNISASFVCREPTETCQMKQHSGRAKPLT